MTSLLSSIPSSLQSISLEENPFEQLQLLRYKYKIIGVCVTAGATSSLFLLSHTYSSPQNIPTPLLSAILSISLIILALLGKQYHDTITTQYTIFRQQEEHRQINTI